jgi:hypothetical protein
MRCIFCKSNSHTKSNCSNSFTREKEESILACVQTTYTVSQRLHLTREEFNESMNIILSRKYKLIELKMAIECVKKRTGERININTNKDNLIRILTDSLSVIFNYTFAPPLSPEHILNTHRLTSGISQLTREILHPRVGNIQPRAVVSFSHYIPHRPQQHFQRVYNSPPNLIQNSQPHLPLLPVIYPSYTIHKTDKKCNEFTECAICLQTITNDTYVYFECLHEFCKNCVNVCLSKQLFNCSLCRSSITKIYTNDRL